MATLISSQRYLDEETVQAKSEQRDYVIHVGPAFEVEGEHYRVLHDGHHSLAAAKQDGVEPIVIEMDERDNDNVAAITQRGDVEGYLEQSYIDSAWYDTSDGVDVF